MKPSQASKPFDSASSLNINTKEELLAMDDGEICKCSENDLKFNSHSLASSSKTPLTHNQDFRTLGFTPTLDTDRLHQKISPSDHCIQSSQQSAKHKILSSLEKLSHSLETLRVDLRNPQCCHASTSMTPNHKDFTLRTPKFPPSITLIPVPPEPPTTLRDAWNNGSYHSRPDEPKYTVFQVRDKVSSVDSQLPLLEENSRYLGNSNNPERRLDVCRSFSRLLNTSDFPFSNYQRMFLHEIGIKIGKLHHLPKQTNEGIFTHYREEELKLKANLDVLISLLASTDYQTVSSVLINRHVAAMISDLEFWIERDPIIPFLISGKIPYFVDPAAYLISKLVDAFPNATEEKIEEAFFATRKQSHEKLIQLISKSKFPFTSQQKSDIQTVSEALLQTDGDPDSEKEREFQNALGKFAYDLNFNDIGLRTGFSNPKKIRKEFNRLVSDLIDLGNKERAFLKEFNRYSLHPQNLIHTFTSFLHKAFIPRYTLSLSPNATSRSLPSILK